jgi:hypothetical protein
MVITLGIIVTVTSGKTRINWAMIMAVVVYKSLKSPKGPALDKSKNIVTPAITGGSEANVDNTGLILFAHLCVFVPKYKPKGIAKTLANKVALIETYKLVKMICSISIV